jgi:hypothetical protein
LTRAAVNKRHDFKVPAKSEVRVGNVNSSSPRLYARRVAVPAGDAFTTAAGPKTALKNYSAATAVGIWNSLTGVTPVRKLKDAGTAARRIFAEVQKLGGPDAVATEAPVDAPKTKRAPTSQGQVGEGR